MRHFLTLNDYSKEEILEIIDLSFKIKKKMKKGKQKSYLKHQTLGMIFEKSSTRTRVSFEAGMYQLGGHALFLSNNDIQLGRGELMKDTARVITRMIDMVMIRTFSQSSLEEFAQHSLVPVINGLTDSYHPVQLMADYMTILEFSKYKDIVVAYIGDGNNIAHSWLMLADKLDFELRIATPIGYECDEKIIKDISNTNTKIIFFNDPKEAVKDATVVTTDTWVSMGQEEEKEKKLKDFAGFKVNTSLMKKARKDVIFLHCLPAYRGYEVSEEVLESKQSMVFMEAENRLHAQKGIMVWLDRNRG